MRTIHLDGKRIKELRNVRDRGSTQKEFAHEIGISERKLRDVENSNAPLRKPAADRIAAVLRLPLNELLLAAAVAQGSPGVVSGGKSFPIRPCEILPRMDETYAGVVKSEADLIDETKRCKTLISHVFTSLNAETSDYAEELLSILDRFVWAAIDTQRLRGGPEEIAARRRIRELLVLLKGNDVWVYADSNIKTLPESFELQPRESQKGFEFQLVLAFGPPGEYGETTIKVSIDRGQPRELVWP